MINSKAKDTVRLNRSHSKRAAEVLVRAFWNHPPLQYYFPDEAERERIALYFFSLPVLNGIDMAKYTPHLKVWRESPFGCHPTTTPLHYGDFYAPFHHPRFSALPDTEGPE